MKLGNAYAIVILDLYTRYFEIKPVRKQTGKNVVAFLKEIFARQGTPQQLISDNGKEFANQWVKQFL